jgi:hypothetical protein
MIAKQYLAPLETGTRMDTRRVTEKATLDSSVSTIKCGECASLPRGGAYIGRGVLGCFWVYLSVSLSVCLSVCIQFDGFRIMYNGMQAPLWGSPEFRSFERLIRR